MIMEGPYLTGHLVINKICHWSGVIVARNWEILTRLHKNMSIEVWTSTWAVHSYRKRYPATKGRIFNLSFRGRLTPEGKGMQSCNKRCSKLRKEAGRERCRAKSRFCIATAGSTPDRCSVWPIRFVGADIIPSEQYSHHSSMPIPSSTHLRGVRPSISRSSGSA